MFSPVLFQPDGLFRSLEGNRDAEQEVNGFGENGAAAQGGSLIDKVQGVVGDYVKRFFSPSYVSLFPASRREMPDNAVFLLLRELLFGLGFRP